MCAVNASLNLKESELSILALNNVFTPSRQTVLSELKTQIKNKGSY
jgi:hypothetical protein